MIREGQVIIVGGQVAFVLRLPAGQVEFSGLFLTQLHCCSHTVAGGWGGVRGHAPPNIF